MMDIYDESGLLVDIDILLEGKVSNLNGLSKIQADDIFGKRAVEQAILNFNSCKIPKNVLIDRLVDADLFAIAIHQIKKDDLLYERWQASNTVDSANPDVRKLLSAIGGDLDILLAPSDL